MEPSVDALDTIIVLPYLLTYLSNYA